MSSGILLNKEKSLILDKTDIENNKIKNINTNPIPNNNLNQYNDNSNLINSNNNIDNNNKMAYSLTESALNQRQINIPKGEMTDFNRNFNGEIKLDKSKQEKTVVCWHCNSLLVVKEGWEIVECSECNKLNRISVNNLDNESHSGMIDVAKSYGNLNTKGDVPYMYGIVVCPMCETENRFSKYATNINCYKCGYTIFLKDSPFNNGINDISRSYDFSRRNNLNYGYVNPPIYNPNVIQVRGIIPMPPMVPIYNNDYTLLKILKLLKKRPKETYIPYPMFPYYRLDDEPKRQIRYVPINTQKKESNDENFKITIRKKPKNKFLSANKNRYQNNNNAFEKVFFTKLK